MSYLIHHCGSSKKPTEPWQLTVDHYKPKQIVGPSPAAVSDTISLVEQVNTSPVMRVIYMPNAVFQYLSGRMKSHLFLPGTQKYTLTAFPESHLNFTAFCQNITQREQNWTFWKASHCLLNTWAQAYQTSWSIIGHYSECLGEINSRGRKISLIKVEIPTTLLTFRGPVTRSMMEYPLQNKGRTIASCNCYH